MSATEESTARIEDEELELEQAEDWEEEPLARRPRRRLLTPLTALLFALLVGAGGFIAGVLVEKGQVPTASAAGGGGSGRLTGLLGGATGTGGRSGAAGSSGSGEGTPAGATTRSGASIGGSGAGATVGQVANISGSDLYVTELQGNTIKVAASAAQITKQVSTSVKGVHPGDNVVILGTHRPDGSIEAATVRDSGSSSAGGSIGALFGAGGARAGSGAGSSATGGGGGGGGPALFGR